MVGLEQTLKGSAVCFSTSSWWIGGYRRGTRRSWAPSFGLYSGRLGPPRAERWDGRLRRYCGDLVGAPKRGSQAPSGVQGAAPTAQGTFRVLAEGVVSTPLLILGCKGGGDPAGELYFGAAVSGKLLKHLCHECGGFATWVIKFYAAKRSKLGKL